MKELLKAMFLRYFRENIQELLAFDMHLARLLGAPSPHTLSSYAWVLEKAGKPWGKLWRPVIDWLAFKIFKQTDHCRKAFEKM